MILFQKNMRTQLNVVLLLFVIAPVSVVLLVSYNTTSVSIKNEIYTKLGVISKSRAKIIEDHISERKEHLELLIRNPMLIDAFKYINSKKHKLASDVYEEIPENVKLYLKDYKDTSHLYDLFLINALGDIVFTVVKEDDFGTNVYNGKFKKTPLAKNIIDAKRTSKIQLSDFMYYEPSEQPAAFLSSPVYIKNKYVGSLAFQVNADELYKLVTDYIGLGDTGEIILATKTGEVVKFLTPLRHDEKEIYRTIKMGSEDAKPMQLALSGEVGEGVFTDYRGEEVIANWRYLDEFHWGMVVKVDEKEALLPIYELRNLYAALVLLVVAMLFILGSVAKNFSYSIRRLANAAKSMSDGDLSIRTDSTKFDAHELVKLSQSFNVMAESQQKYIQDIYKSKLQMEQIVSNAAQGIITIDKNQIIVLANDHAEYMFGYNKDELLGKNLSILIPDYAQPGHPEQLEKFVKLPVNVIGKGMGSHRYIEGKNIDGYLFPIQAAISKMKIDGEWFFTAFITDISEQMIKEKELLKAKDDAEKANKSKSLFLANMSHELRTPMHGILSFASFGITKSKDIDNEKIPFYFRQIEESGQRLMRLLNDLLDLAKLESGKMDMEFNLQSIIDVCNIVIQEQQLRLNEKDMEIIWDKGSDDFLLEFDKPSMIQVVTNLFSNAIKFNQDGQPIVITMKKKEIENGANGLFFSMRDHGVGIPEDEFELIFSRFDQSSRTITGAGGTGLGLPICKEIIDAHQGKIWAENHPEGGAVFNFIIPNRHNG